MKFSNNSLLENKWKEPFGERVLPDSPTVIS